MLTNECPSLPPSPLAIFLIDAQEEVYLWLGWWPQQKNTLLQEKNSLTGSAHSRWLRDKKLALQTALNYANGMRTCTIIINNNNNLYYYNYIIIIITFCDGKDHVHVYCCLSVCLIQIHVHVVSCMYM